MSNPLKTCALVARRLKQQTWSERALFAEAFLYLGAGRLSVLVVPFRWTAAWLGRVSAETIDVDDPASRAAAERIGTAIARVSRHTPWRSNCLPQALAAHAMLRHRRVATTVHFGLAKDSGARLRAHVWVKCGDVVVTGGRGHARFTPVMNVAALFPRRGSTEWSA
jgi:transglutaminase superfamily protein